MAVASGGGKEPENVLKDLLSIQVEVSTDVVVCIPSMPKKEARDILAVGGALPFAYLQVTERLLDAEEQKLRLLKAEIAIARHKGGAVTKVSNLTLAIFKCYHACIQSRELDMQENTLM